MITRLLNYLMRLRANQRIAIAMARAAATAPLRKIDATRPATWEFSAFSQNGEDGIIDYLVQNLSTRSRNFLEIGAADGLENLTAWLALAHRFSGVMIEGDGKQARKARLVYPSMNLGVSFRHLFVDRDNINSLMAEPGLKDADLFSLDIDGMDYYVAQTILDAGARPKIIAVEYNAIFGSERAVTVPYAADFDRLKAHDTGLYYGVSIGGWRKALATRGYEFVTVDQNGVNAFFVRPDAFPAGFVAAIRGQAFGENFSQVMDAGDKLSALRQMILTLPLVEI